MFLINIPFQVIKKLILKIDRSNKRKGQFGDILVKNFLGLENDYKGSKE